MKISVKISKDKLFDIEVQPTDTVSSVMQQIVKSREGQTYYPSGLQEQSYQLRYQGMVLKDETTIEENKVIENTFLVLSRMPTERGILKSEPQNPITKEFSFCHLEWHAVKEGRKINKVAVIPNCRVEDFVKGEGSRAGCTIIKTTTDPPKEEGRRRCNPRVDRTLESSVYQCCHGPDDKREGGEARKSRKGTKPSEKKCPGRPIKRIGCKFKFTVKHKKSQSDVAIIIFNQPEHIDKSGSICHRPEHVNKSDSTCLGPKHVSKSGSTFHLQPLWLIKKKRTVTGGKLKEEEN